jgi:hypothetical protein
MDNVDLEQIQQEITQFIDFAKNQPSEDAIDDRKRELAELIQPHVFKMVGSAESKMDKKAAKMLGGDNYEAYIDGNRVVISIQIDDDTETEIPVQDYSHDES